MQAWEASYTGPCESLSFGCEVFLILLVMYVEKSREEREDESLYRCCDDRLSPA